MRQHEHVSSWKRNGRPQDGNFFALPALPLADVLAWIGTCGAGEVAGVRVECWVQGDLHAGLQ